MLSGGSVGFDTIKAVVLKPNCLQCHAGASSSKGIDLSTYAAVMSNPSGLVVPGHASHSLFYLALTGNGTTPMPKDGSPLAPSLVNLVGDWIDAGAPEFAKNPTTLPSGLPVIDLDPTQKMGFKEITQGIINKYGCISCHKGKTAAHRIDLSSYAALLAKPYLVIPKDALDSNIFRCTQPGADPQMPKTGDGFSKKPLTLTDMQALANWINDGAPEFANGAPAPEPTYSAFPLGVSPTGAPLRSYVKDVAPILQANCVSCHGGAKPADGKDFSSYAGLMAAADDQGLVVTPGKAQFSQLYETLFAGNTAGFALMPARPKPSPSATPLPPTPLSDDDRQIIADWINQGAVEIVSSTPILRSYTKDIAPFLQTNCIRCHSGGPDKAADGKDYTTYQNLMATTDDNGPIVVPKSGKTSQFYQTLRIDNTYGYKLMPRDTIVQLPDSTLQMIEDWIDQGAVENLP